MTLGLAFYILMLIWAVFGVWWNWPNHQAVGGNLLLFVLLLLLGWRVFGAPIHGWQPWKQKKKPRSDPGLRYVFGF